MRCIARVPGTRCESCFPVARTHNENVADMHDHQVVRQLPTGEQFVRVALRADRLLSRRRPDPVAAVAVIGDGGGP